MAHWSRVPNVAETAAHHHAQLPDDANCEICLHSSSITCQEGMRLVCPHFDQESPSGKIVPGHWLGECHAKEAQARRASADFDLHYMRPKPWVWFSHASCAS